METISRRGPDSAGSLSISLDLVQTSNFGKTDEKQSEEVILEFMGSTLQLRGSHQVVQPLKNESGDILIFNGTLLNVCFLSLFWILSVTSLNCGFCEIQDRFLQIQFE